MNYKLFLYIFFVLFLNSCIETTDINYSTKPVIIEKFSNKGFALLYDDDLFKKKIIKKKINERDLIIFQKNLKKGTPVKIFNPTNKKSLIAKVGKNSTYPNFNNSVISKRIFDELELDLNDPYIHIVEIIEQDTFIAKKTKTFESEKKVANKAPVESISVNDLNESNKKIKKDKKKNRKKFIYNIKIADFYFEKTAISMINRVKTETSIKNAKIKEVSKNKFRVYIGPYSNLKTLQKAYNSVEKLEFENIEILRHE